MEVGQLPWQELALHHGRQLQLIVDPRDFALLAFGGAAGLHATELARQLGMHRVIIPRVASVLSAWGMLNSDLRFELSRTHIGDTEALSADDLRAMYHSLETDAR